MPRLTTMLKSFAAAAALTAALPGAASAAPTLDGSFAPSDKPRQIATGPDGSAWFTSDGAKEFGRIAPDGTITEYDTPGAVTAQDIVAGPDAAGGPNNRIWISFNGGVIKVDPANPNAGQSFAIATINGARGIAPDASGNLWVVDDNDGLVKVAPNGTKIADVPVAGSSGRDIALGSDGRMWWADFGGSAIRATETAGNTTATVPVTAAPQGIAAGPGGQVAFGSPNNLLGRLGTAGGPQYTTDTGADAGFGLTFAGDGAYWATRFASDGLGRLEPGGAYTTPIAFPAGSGPRNIARGANDTLWVTLEGSNRIARISGVTPPGGGGGGGGATTPRDTAKPRLAALKVNAAKRRLTVRLSEAATLRLTIERRTAGKRSGKRCLAPKKGRKGKRCVRYVKVRSLRKAGTAGANTVSLGKKLKAARYRVSLVAVDKAGNRSAVAKKGFTVKRTKKARKRK